MQRADKILLCTHGHFGEKLKEAAEMIAGSMERLKTFSLLPGMTAEELSGMIEQELQDGKLSLCLVDIAGGTPFNVMVRLTAQYPISVVTGVNMAMLIDVYESMDELEYDKLAQCAIESLVSSGRVIHPKGANTDE